MEDGNWNCVEENNIHVVLNEIDIIGNNEKENDNKLISCDNKYIMELDMMITLQYMT